MFKVQNLTNNSRQKQTLVLPDGTFMTLELYFISMQLGWFITSLTYKDFQLNGVRIVNSPNFLYQWRNQLPFGIACVSPSKREPSQQDDFLTDASILYVLTADEVQQYTEFLSGQV